MTTLKYMFAAASLGAVMMSTGAQAADLGGYKDDPVAAYNQSIWGPGWALRVRALGVLPDESSANWKVNGQTNTAALGKWSPLVSTPDSARQVLIRWLASSRSRIVKSRS